MLPLPTNLPSELLTKDRINRTRKKWLKYLELTAFYLQENIDLYKLYGNKNLVFPVALVSNKLGTLTVNGKQKRAWNIFFKAHPFFGVYKKGNSFTGNTQILILEPKEVRNLLAQIKPQTTFSANLKDIKNLPVIPVNRTSMENYLQFQENQISKGLVPNSNRPSKKREIFFGQRILDILDEAKANGIAQDLFPYNFEKSVFGRTYHKGLNLQNAPRNLRDAALGDCYEYDINSSALALKLDFIHKKKGALYCQKTYPISLNYLKNKAGIRKALCSHVCSQMHITDPDEKEAITGFIKQYLTAIMFGATQDKGGWFAKNGKWTLPSLAQIFPEKETAGCLKKAEISGIPFVPFFISEQNEMLKEICGYLTTDPVYSGKLGSSDLREKVQTKTGRWKKSSVFAYYYQHEEALILSGLKNALGSDVILDVHDALYVKSEIPLVLLGQIQKNYSGYVTFGKRKISAF